MVIRVAYSQRGWQTNKSGSGKDIRKLLRGRTLGKIKGIKNMVIK